MPYQYLVQQLCKLYKNSSWKKRNHHKRDCSHQDGNIYQDHGRGDDDCTNNIKHDGDDDDCTNNIKHDGDDDDCTNNIKHDDDDDDRSNHSEVIVVERDIDRALSMISRIDHLCGGFKEYHHHHHHHEGKGTMQEVIGRYI